MRASLILVATLLVVACSSIRDREVTAENSEQVLRDIAQSRELTPEEAQLVAAYVARNRIGATLGMATDATLPATIGQSIERQRAFVARLEEQERQRAAEEARRQEEARLAAQRRLAEIEALRASVPGQVTAIRFFESNWRTRRYRDELAFDVRVTNAGARPVRGVRGRFVFLDTFGAEVSSVSIGVEQDIAPGQSFESVFTKDYNQFMVEDRALRGFDLTRGTVRWEPLHVVYTDGTSVEIPAAPGA